jgi:hypothetical protein
VGKIISLILIAAGIIGLIYAFQSFSPVSLTELISPQGETPFSDSACTRIVIMKGSSMEPTFNDGQTTTFNKCIDEKREKLKVGTIILIEKTFLPEEILVIRKKAGTASATTYIVSTARNPSSTKEIPASDIKAIYEGR